MTNWIEITRMRMDQAAERRVDAKTQAQYDHAERVFQAAASDWKEAVAEAKK